MLPLICTLPLRRTLLRHVSSPSHQTGHLAQTPTHPHASPIASFYTILFPTSCSRSRSSPPPLPPPPCHPPVPPSIQNEPYCPPPYPDLAIYNTDPSLQVPLAIFVTAFSLTFLLCFTNVQGGVSHKTGLHPSLPTCISCTPPHVSYLDSALP